MKKPDWEAIRREYETDGTTVRKLAEKYGVSHTAINKRAKSEGWKKYEGKKVSAEKKSVKKVSMIKVETHKVETTKKAVKYDDQESISDSENLEGEVIDLGFTPAEFGISGQQALFVYWYIKTRNRVMAYKKAKYKCTGLNVYPAATQVYRNIHVAKAIRVLEKRVSERYTANLDELVDQLVSITRADPNAISQYRRVNCRYCWGENHLYQWRDIQEFDRAAAKNAKDGKPEPEYGGLGFINNMDPNSDCPRCNGEGIGEIKLGDTRDLDADEHAYFLGVKQTKNGIEVITESKQAARAMLIKLLTQSDPDKDKEPPPPQYDLSHLSYEQLLALRKKSGK